MAVEQKTEPPKTDYSVNIKNILNRQKQGKDTRLMQEYLAQGKKELDDAYYEKRIQDVKTNLSQQRSKYSDPVLTGNNIRSQAQATAYAQYKSESERLNQLEEEYKKFKYEQKAGKARSLLHKDYDENQDGGINLQDVLKAQLKGDSGRDIQRSLTDGMDMQERIKQIYDTENGNYNIQDETGRPLDPATFPAGDEENRSTYEKFVEEKKQNTEQIKRQLTSDGYDVDALLDVYTREENAKRREREKKITEKFAEEHPVESSIGSVLATPAAALGIFELIPRGIKELTTGEYDPVDPNSPFFTGVQMKNDIRGKVSENMEGWQSFLYQTGMSMGDFLSLLPLGEVGSLAIMGSSAASDASLKVAENGGSAT